MGERGPPPKPTALRELEGNPSGRPLNQREPKPQKISSVEPPSWMSEQAKVYWYRAVPVLSRMGVLTEADLPLLERYCDFLADWKACRDFLATRGNICYPIYDGDKYEDQVDPTTGLPIKDPITGATLRKRVLKYLAEYPQVSKKIRFSEHLLKIEMHFGMTPASRSRIITDEIYGGQLSIEAKDVDPFDPEVN